MHKKRLAAELRPDPLGELKRSPYPQAAVDEDNYNLSSQFGAHCGEGGEWICVEWAEMNERGYFKTRHRQ